MAGQDHRLRAAVHQLAEQMCDSGEAKGHLTVESIFAYHAGECSQEDAEALRNHACVCGECCSLLLDAHAFLAHTLPLQEDFGLVWERLRRAMHADEEWSPESCASPLPAAEVGPRARRTFRSSRLLPYGLAASLLLASVGLSLRTASLEQQVARLSAPTAQVEVVDLVPEGSHRRGGSLERIGKVQMPADAERLVLLLHLQDLQRYPEYRLVLLDGASRSVWQTSGVRPDRDGNFSVDLGRHFLPIGRYRFELYGREGEREARVAVYPVERTE